MELSQYAELFRSESREHLSAINNLLLELEEDAGSREAVEGVFRAVHTVKGMSATMGYRAVADLAHEMESLLDGVRTGRIDATPGRVDLLLAAADALEGAVAAAVEGRPEPDVSTLVGRLRAEAGGEGGAAGEEAEPEETLADLVAGAGGTEEDGGAAGGLGVRVRVSPDSMLGGVRAFLAVRAARALGEVDAVDPPEATLQGEGFGGTVRFRLRTDREPGAVREAILAVGEIEGVEVVEVAAADESAADAASSTSTGAAGPRRAASQLRSVRVDLRRLDALMNQVGELVIVRDRMRALAGREGELAETVDQASRLISELQDEIVRARMAPVWQVFDRFPRLVRDAARQLGKRVRFAIEGKEIELDRSMLDEIGDPLVHLLRNALDHGIEPPEERRAAGKPEAGTLRLTASRERSRVVIRVEDDGRGIQRERVVRKAVALGMVAEDAAGALSDEEVHHLLTRPGFSTAETVTDVSGRGVGLDVVATKIRALGGTMDVASEPGRGTTFTLQLPLTLAIVRALLVRLGEESYALPLTHVGETVHLADGDVGTVNGRRVATLRDEVLPLLSLREVLRRGVASDGEGEGARRRHAVILEVGEQRVGIEVDRLLGQQEIVVKAFDAAGGTLRLFSGATILSDGRPALILDAGSLAAAERDAAA